MYWVDIANVDKLIVAINVCLWTIRLYIYIISVTYILHVTEIINRLVFVENGYVG